MSLICPKCLSDMSALQYQGVTIDVCPGCRGIWLDPGELAYLLGADEDLPRLPESMSTGTRFLQTSTYICPRCQGGFDTFEYAPGTDLFIDRCKECKGIWLDSGELKKIRDISARRKTLGLDSPADHQRRLREVMERQRARHSDRTRSSKSSSSSGAGVYFFQLLTGLPVEVDSRRERFPAMTVFFIVSCIAVFLLQVFVFDPGRMFYFRYAFVPDLLGEPEGWLGLFSSMFLHGGWLHLLGNMYFLWLFGDNVEDRLNRVLFVFFYLLCGIAASLVHAALTDMPGTPTLGASGAISGIMGAYLVLYPRRRMYQMFWFIQFKVSVAFYLLFWLGIQILFSSMGSAGVAWFAHIGGFAVGAAGIWILKQIGLVRPDPYLAPLPAR